MVGVKDSKDKIMRFFRTNITENFCKPTHVNNEYEIGKTEITKKRKQSEDKIIRAIKDIIYRDIDNIFE